MMILKVITQPIILYLLDRYFYIIGVMNNLFKVKNNNKKRVMNYIFISLKIIQITWF